MIVVRFSPVRGQKLLFRCSFAELRCLSLHFLSKTYSDTPNDGRLLLPGLRDFLGRSKHLEDLEVKVGTAHHFLCLQPLQPENLWSLSVSPNPGPEAFQFIAKQQHLRSLSVRFGASGLMQPGEAYSGDGRLSSLKAVRTDNIDHLGDRFGLAIGAISHLIIEGRPPIKLDSAFMAPLGRCLRCLELHFTSREGLDFGYLSPLHALFPSLVELAVEMLGHMRGSLPLNSSSLASVFVLCQELVPRLTFAPTNPPAYRHADAANEHLATCHTIRRHAGEASAGLGA